SLMNFALFSASWEICLPIAMSCSSEYISGPCPTLRFPIALTSASLPDFTFGLSCCVTVGDCEVEACPPGVCVTGACAGGVWSGGGVACGAGDCAVAGGAC